MVTSAHEMLLFKATNMLPLYLVIPQETSISKHRVCTASAYFICWLNELNEAIIYYPDKETQQSRGLPTNEWAEEAVCGFDHFRAHVQKGISVQHGAL